MIEYIETYIKIASPVGIIAMYACVKAYETKKPFKLELFFDFYTQVYCYGFLISVNCSGIISLITNNNNGFITVNEIIPDAQEFIENSFNLIDFSQDKNLMEWKNNIISYFEN